MRYRRRRTFRRRGRTSFKRRGRSRRRRSFGPLRIGYRM